MTSNAASNSGSGSRFQTARMNTGTLYREKKAARSDFYNVAVIAAVDLRHDLFMVIWDDYKLSEYTWEPRKNVEMSLAFEEFCDGVEQRVVLQARQANADQWLAVPGITNRDVCQGLSGVKHDDPFIQIKPGLTVPVNVPLNAVFKCREDRAREAGEAPRYRWVLVSQ